MTNGLDWWVAFMVGTLWGLFGIPWLMKKMEKRDG